MKAKITTIILLIIILAASANGQAKEYYINDIFQPDLKGPVRSFTEFIMGGTDTLRVMKITYSNSGFRNSLYIRSTHKELGFANDTVCYKAKGKEIVSTNCKSDIPTNTTISFGDNGLINEIDIMEKDQTIGYFPEYNKAKRLTGINTSRSKNNTFQFIATLTYALNANGSIKETEAMGGDQPQGKTSYQYDKNLLVKSIRSGFDGDKTFRIEYALHDEKGNWTHSTYQNGVTVNRMIEYY